MLVQPRLLSSSNDFCQKVELRKIKLNKWLAEKLRLLVSYENSAGLILGKTLYLKIFFHWNYTQHKWFLQSHIVFNAFHPTHANLYVKIYTLTLLDKLDWSAGCVQRKICVECTSDITNARDKTLILIWRDD